MGERKLRIKFSLNKKVALCMVMLFLATVAIQLFNLNPVFADDGGYYWIGATAINPPAPDYGSDYGYTTCPPSDTGCMGITYVKGTTTYGEDDPFGYVVRNCTSYVAWKINQIFGISLNRYGNGKDWANSANAAGYHVYPSSSGYIPMVGDIAQYNARTGDSDGHVAYVSGVTNGVASLYEYNVGYDGLFYSNRTSSSNPPDNYIHISYPDGTFIQTPNGSIYEMAGGSAFYVPNWNEVGGSHSYSSITDQTIFNNFPTYPSDGTFFQVYGSYSIYETAGGTGFYVPNWNEVGGSHAFSVLPATGVSQKMRQYPLDGTFFQVYGSPSFYETAGGASFYIANWNEVGGYHAYVDLPATGVSQTMRQYPLDGTYFSVYGSPSSYISAGGMGLYISSWSAIGGSHSTTALPATGVSYTMRSYALDGTYVKGYASGEEFEAMGGAVTRITSTPLPAATIVDDWAIINQLHGTE